MRERKTWLVVTFHTTAAAIGMEKLCALEALAAGEGLEVEGFYELTL